MIRNISLLVFLLLFTTSSLWAQQTENSTQSVDNKTTYSGIVIDLDGNSVSDVSITIKETNKGTVSNQYGRFFLTVAEGSTLEISHLSFHTKTVIVGAQRELEIMLEPKNLSLEGVTVTALGIRKQERAVGYSVTTVKGDNLDENAINPITALQGKVAGLHISGTNGGIFERTKITMRGASTLNKNNQPLIVIDGVALFTGIFEGEPNWTGNPDDYGDELKNLNPADIESISVLKGAAATALYGSRGLNGALVITTKNGGKQAGYGVTVSQSVGFDIVLSTPHLQTTYGPGAIAGDISYGNRDENGNFYRWDTNQFYTNNDGQTTLIGANGNAWGPRFDGRDVILYDGTTGEYSPQKNSYKDFYRPAFNSNTNVTIRGGNDRSTFYLSIGYRYSDGMLPSSSFSRGSTLLKGSHRISNRVSVDAQVSFAHSKPQNSMPSIGDYYINRNINQLYDSRYYSDKYKGLHGGMASTTQGDAYANVPVKNLWWLMYENSVEQREMSIHPAINLNITIMEWLRFKAEANTAFYNTEKETKWLGQGYRNEGNNDDLGGKYEMRKTENREENLAGTFTFHKIINDFDLGGFIRGEYRNSKADRTLNTTTGGLITPNVYSLTNGRGTPRSEYKITSRKRVLSAVFAANAGWRDQLYLEVTGRNDWSSSLVYSNGNGNYSYFYPSVSASWIVSESFRKQFPSWITLGKFRLSWAQVGNDAEPFAINPGYEQKKYLQPDGTYIYSEIVPSTLYSRDALLKPERKNAWEIGADWRFLYGRIGADIALYKENTYDQIMNIPIPKESGTTSRMVNAGNIENKGIEIALTTIPVKTKSWQWNVDFTFARNRNKIISLHPDVQKHINLSGEVGGGNYRVAAVAIAGSDYGMLVSDIMPARDESGNIVLSWDDEYRAAYPKRGSTVEKIGSMMPDWTGSVATGLRYKNLTFRALLDIRWGGLIASYSNRYGTAYGLTETSLRWRDADSGGTFWTSAYADSYGQSFNDGVIPEGVFDAGTVVTTPSGDRVDVSGLTFREAYERGYVEPVHSSSYQSYSNGWSTGTVNDSWVHEVKYIALRELSLSYRLPNKAAGKLGMQKMDITLSAHNLGYLYNSLPNNLHPESIRGTGTADFRERGFIPYTATFMATITMEF